MSAPETTDQALTLAKALVQHLGGWIAVSSALGQGSTFTIELPRSAPPAVLPGAPAVVPAAVPDSGSDRAESTTVSSVPPSP